MEPTSHGEEVIHRAGFAPADRRRRYPLPLPRTLDWERRDDLLTADVELPPVPAAHLVVPSFAALGSPGHHCILIDGDARVVTAGTGRPPEQHAGMPGGPTDVHVDYFETSTALSGARMRFCVAAAAAPTDYVAVVGVRPRRTVARPRRPRDTRVLDVPPRTQMSAPERVRSRICSPTCVSMALEHLGARHAFDELVVAAHHRPTNLYGVWPQNLWAASRWGVLGATETATDWDGAAQVLEAGQPFVASIAFDAGTLAGAPLAASRGHLVIVRGIQNNRVLVNDPAGETVTDVPRSYDIEEFTRAWLGARGVFYAFSAPS